MRKKTTAAAKTNAVNVTEEIVPVSPEEPVLVEVQPEPPVPQVVPVEKEVKAKKVKMVRDGFTMPQKDYEQIAILKKKCLTNGVNVKKSELLRAGLLALSAMNDQDLLAIVAQVEQVKTGRPSKK